MFSDDSPLRALELAHSSLQGDRGLGGESPHCARRLRNSTLGDLTPTSTGATALVPNARANRVSWVADLRVVLYAHNTSRRYSTHFPFRSSSFVFNAALRVLIVTYACPLDCG